MSNFIDLLEYFQDKFSSQSWKVDTLSGNPNISWNYISKNLDKKWN